MRQALVGGAALVGCLLAGCSSGSSSAPADPTTSVAAPASQGAAPPSPSASAPTKAEDAADLEQAIVTAADLGKPWTQPKAVSRVKSKKGEVCPGHVSATEKLPVTADVAAAFTEGRGEGKNIASFGLSTLKEQEESASALVAAHEKDQRACARYRDGNGLFVVRSAAGPASVGGTDLVASWVERIYHDKAHQKLAYARHALVARQGRVVTFLSYAFLAGKEDPEAEDFSAASRLMEVQLAKNAEVFT